MEVLLPSLPSLVVFLSKVTSLNGPINVGDPITSSNITGVGMKQTQPGTILGRVIESVNSWNTGNCTIVGSLADANAAWPYDPNGANNNPACFAIPTANLTNVPASYTQPYVYISKVTIKVDKGYNMPEMLLTTNGDLDLAQGSTVNPSDLVNAATYYLVDQAKNVVTNAQSFSDVLSANGTFGSLRAGTVQTTSIDTASLFISGTTIKRTDSGLLCFH